MCRLQGEIENATCRLQVGEIRRCCVEATSCGWDPWWDAGGQSLNGDWRLECEWSASR